MAETFLERVVAQESENIVAWTLYLILYEQKEEDLNAEITLKKLLRMNQAAQQASALNSTSQVPNDSHLDESERRDDGKKQRVWILEKILTQI